MLWTRYAETYSASRKSSQVAPDAKNDDSLPQEANPRSLCLLPATSKKPRGLAAFALLCSVIIVIETHCLANPPGLARGAGSAQAKRNEKRKNPKVYIIKDRDLS